MAARRYKSSYRAEIRKSDHVDSSGKHDLHVHVFYNEGKSHKLIGRYRLPGLTPVFKSEPELTAREREFLKEWLSQPAQVRKIEGFLRETLFNMHKVGELCAEYGEVCPGDDGETYITIRIPVSKRIQ